MADVADTTDASLSRQGTRNGGTEERAVITARFDVGEADVIEAGNHATGREALLEFIEYQKLNRCNHGRLLGVILTARHQGQSSCDSIARYWIGCTIKEMIHN